jgi:O-methyltransferase
MIDSMKLKVREQHPRLLYLYRVACRLPRELRPVLRFVLNRDLPNTSFAWRVWFVLRMYRISLSVDAQHNQVEMLRVVEAILRVPASVPGCIVECGAFKGASAAKFSLVASRVGRRLFVFDSFEGIPPNEEAAELNIYGELRSFPTGSYAGGLDEVRSTVGRLGDINVCRFVKGWLQDTLPEFKEPVTVAFVDVDLASSTRVAFKFLWPLLAAEGSAFSHDGGLPAVRAVLGDEAFWRDEVGSARPQMQGLGKSRLVHILK